MRKPDDYQKVLEEEKDAKSRSYSSASSKFGDNEIPSKECESSNLNDELVETQIYDEYCKLRILKLLFSPNLKSLNAFTGSNDQLSIPVFCTIELVKL